MNYINSIYLLTQELERAKAKKEWSEKYFAEHGGGSTLGEYCRSLDLIEDYEAALKILKNKKGGQVV